MKRIVFATWGSYGDLHPYMALAAELQGRGNECVIATSPIYREKVEGAGLGFQAVRPELPAPDTEEAAEMIRQVSNNWRGPEYLFREILMPHLRDAYEDTLAASESADLLVSHQVAMTAPIIAEKTGIKWISCVLFPIAFASVYDPPTPPQFPAIRPLVALHPLIGSVLMGIGKAVMEPWVEPVQNLRLELELKRSAHPIFEGQHSPRLVLALFSKLLSEKQPDFPPQTVITGFPFYDEPEVPLDPQLEAFLNDGEPPILFTLGSSLIWTAGNFYKVSVEAAVRLGKRAILLVGDPKNVPADLPPGIAAFDYAPHRQVMPRCSIIVHPGGIGTTGQALRAGRPMLVVPAGQDQPDNARRCVNLGLARTLPLSAYRGGPVTDALRNLLAEDTYAQNAAQGAAMIEREAGLKIASDLIEGVLNS